MRIVQILPVLAFGDAVGNDTRALKDALSEAGYETEIYAAVIDERLPQGTAQPFERLGKLTANDIVIYHLSNGHRLNYEIEKLGGKKVIIYHNITPERYFEKYNRDACANCVQGIKAAKRLAKTADYAIAVSEYNKQDLIRLGFTCDIEVLPILIPFEDYEKKPNAGVLRRYDDDYVNILFTGRIVPNKKQEDVIETFYYYKKYINPKSRLILAGSYVDVGKYHEKLELFARKLGLADVIFTGQIRFDEILAYYRLADVFLCMSEHEGFCVPLVEAMYFETPIVAYASTAIPGTLDGSGVLVETKEPEKVAETMNRIIRDEQYRHEIVVGQKQRLKDFSYENIKEQILDEIEKVQQSKTDKVRKQMAQFKEKER